MPTTKTCTILIDITGDRKCDKKAEWKVTSHCGQHTEESLCCLTDLRDFPTGIRCAVENCLHPIKSFIATRLEP